MKYEYVEPKRTCDIGTAKRQLPLEDITIGMFICNIGNKVYKTSSSKTAQPKPFKSKNKVNTIKDVICHPILCGELAYTFEEDDSYVSCRHCVIVEKI